MKTTLIATILLAALPVFAVEREPHRSPEDSFGETVWEYVNPVTMHVLKQGETVPLDHRYHAQNALFKVQRYPLDYAAFKGRNMKPKYALVETLKDPVSPERRADHEHADAKPDEGKRGGGKGGKKK